MESFSFEIKSNKVIQIILNVVYRPLDGDIDVCENYFKDIFIKDNVINTNVLIAGNFKTNPVHFEQNRKL